MDLIFGIGTWAIILGMLAIYRVRVALKGRSQSARADREGGSIILSKFLVEYGLWMMTPVARFLVRAGVTPDGVTWFSLVPGIGAGIALAYGWFGLATFLGTIAAFSDSVDGFVARLTGLGSEAGETLDAIIDRYVESAFFAGLLVHYRDSMPMVALTATALIGAFMVSYTSAKAEAQQVSPPRGLMRRSERATYLLVGAGLVPFTRAFFADSSPLLYREATMIIVIVAIAIIANLSSLMRVTSIRASLRALESPSNVPHSSAASAAVPNVADTSSAVSGVGREAMSSGALVTSEGSP
ncbi:MAG: CDP-alcohol phosphatidyltransferase family protein [Gemmatimonadaceae bacterium]